MDIRQFTYNLDAIDSISKELLKHFSSKIVLFKGDMGAGKTTLIKALSKAMGSKDVITSPTFSIVNEYDIPNDKIYHFDFYRIEDVEEAYNFGVEDYLYSKHWIFIEWSERITSILPKNVSIVDIKTINETQRSLKLTINKQNLTKNIAYD